MKQQVLVTRLADRHSGSKEYSETVEVIVDESTLDNVLVQLIDQINGENGDPNLIDRWGVGRFHIVVGEPYDD